MLKRILGVIFAIGIAIIPALFTWYLSRSVPDVRYTLSETIPVSLLDPSTKFTESVQQLVVKNIGNAEATKIVTKINTSAGQISSYNVEKYSAGDSVQVFSQTVPFELVYPQLPPQAGFTLVFKSSGSGIQYRDVSISHNAGSAQEALSSSGNNPAVIAAYVIYLVAILFFLLFSANSLRKNTAESWILRKRSETPDDILRLRMPWYMWDKDEKAYLKQLLTATLAENRLWAPSDMRKSAAYRLLSVQKSERLGDADWIELQEVAIHRLEDGYSYVLKNAYHPKPMLELLKIERPQSFPQSEWNDLQTKIRNAFFSEMEKLHDSQAILEELRRARPEEIPEHDWLQHTGKLCERYIASDTSYFVDSEKVLEQLRSPKPAEIPDKYWSKRNEQLCERYIASNASHSFNSKEALEQLRSPKPTEIPDKYWSKRNEQLQKESLEWLSSEMAASNNSLLFLREHDISLLDVAIRDKLELKAFRQTRDKYMPDLTDLQSLKAFVESGKPEWMSNSEFTRIKSIFEKLYCSPKTGHEMTFKTEYFEPSLVGHATAPQTPLE